MQAPDGVGSDGPVNLSKIESEANDDGPVFRIELRANAALSRRQARIWILAIGVLLLGLGIGWFWVGAWLVLPFAGLEYLGLVLALRLSRRDSERVDVIRVEPTKVVVQQSHLGVEKTYEFQRAWVQVQWQEPEHRGYPGSVELRSHGKHVTLGEFLAEPERKKLMQELRKILTNHGKPLGVPASGVERVL